jgi:hypothetical protein
MSGTAPDGGHQPAFDAERHLDAMAWTLSLAISREQRPGILRFLAAAHAMYALASAAPIADGAFDLAPSFRPGRAGETG